MVPVEKIVGAAVAGGANTVKAVFGLVDRVKAQRKINELNANRPVYENQSIKDMMALYQQNANISQMPGEQNMVSRMNANVASSIGQSAQYAPSSAAMLGAVTDIYGKKQEAIRDLATTFAQYKAQRQQELGQAYQVAAQDEAQAWNINKFVPWQVKMNEAVSQRQAGMDALWGGLEGIAASGFALAGSSYQGQTMNSQRQGPQAAQTQMSTAQRFANTNSQSNALQASNFVNSGNASSINGGSVSSSPGH